jgi:hypothetical protein
MSQARGFDIFTRWHGWFGCLVCGKWQSAAFDIAVTVIKRGQFDAQIHNREVHESAAGGAAVFLGGGNQARSQARTLQFRLDREQTEISAIFAQFYIDTAGQRTRFLGKQELSFLHQCANFFGVGAVAVNEEAFRAKGEIHQARNVLGMVDLCRTSLHLRHTR